MSSSKVKLAKFLIPLHEIRVATQNFSKSYVIGRGGYGETYKADLLRRSQSSVVAIKRFDVKAKHEFLNVVEMMSEFNHKNIISFIGYCDEEDITVTVFEFAFNGNLDLHLHDPDKKRYLTWAQRLKICIGIARGLEYLHSGLGDNRRVFHGDIKSSNILLDGNLEAKISDFILALLVDRNQPLVRKKVAGTMPYMDPIYKESGVLNTEADVYSFGIILFEMLTGMLTYVERVIDDDAPPQKLINLVRRYSHDESLDKLVDPSIKDQIDTRSFLAFKGIAYQCISWNLRDRPTMNTIINKIQEALEFQKQADASTKTIRSYQPQNLSILQIPLEEILSTTENFSPETCIGSGGFGKVYKGCLNNRIVSIKNLIGDSQAGDQFRKELEMLSRFQHQNIIALVGYCDEGEEMIIVYEYASNGSLDGHLQGPDKGGFINWAQRLKICLGVARGLEYLHSSVDVDNIVIHQDIKSSNILLDDHLEAKIYDFGLSLLVDRNQPHVYHLPRGTSYYMDPIYGESGIVNTELDVYAFGVVMLEMLSGKLASTHMGTHDDDIEETLTMLVRRYYYDDGADILIDPLIRDQINVHSFHVFVKIAYRCISYNLKERPTMKRIIKRIEEALDIQTRTHMTEGTSSIVLTRGPQHHDLDRFRILLDDINYTPDKEHRIGDGGFGKVYKGQISKGLSNCIVAIKCLDLEGKQGEKEFLTEVGLISSFHHPNIIPFVGYCDEGGQMIMVSEYAINGSLDHHLSDPIRRKRLTWSQRLKICLGAAKGLDYLHSGPGKGRVIHRDVKSGNILLDKNLEAKLCDFGLSKQGPINQHTQIYTKAAGTIFYLDPVYHESGILSKESDIYSFGVVLFEMLCGTLVYNQVTFVDGSPQYLMVLVRRYCNNEPKKLIDPDIRDEVDDQCFDTFKELAFQCINFKSEERPTMDTIIDRLEDAIEFQEHKVYR